MTVTQTTQSPNMTGHTQTGNAAKNFEQKQQRLAEGSAQPVMLSGAEMLVQALTDEGVEYIFGYPGGAVLHIYDALFQQENIEHILVRHEQAAGHMADAYSRVTGNTGVVLATSGPGATNTVTAIATAFMDSVPMVVIAGQVPSSLIGEDAFQETDMVGVSRPIVKHSFQVRHASEIPMIVKKAFYIAQTGRPGPVVIDVPKDMTAPSEKFAYEYPEEVFIRSYQPSLKGHSGQIKKAIEALLAAQRPVVYAGGGVIWSNAHEELTDLAHRLNLPVTNTLMGLGTFPGSDRQFLGMLGMHGTYEANMSMHHADVILAVGARFDDRVTNNVKKFCPNATIIHIDIDPASISKTILAHIPIVGDVKSVLTDMLEIVGQDKQLEQHALLDWWSQINEWRKRHGLRYDTSTDNGIKPQSVVQALDKVTNSNAIITSDVGQHQMFAALYYTYNEPRQWLNSGGLGTMGVGLPYAMAAKLANPERDVVCITGEGSIQMNIQELSTCLQYNLPVKILNINNAQLGMVKQWQDMLYEGRHAQSYMNSLPDFVKLAESYGHVGIKITDPATMEAQLAEAMAMKDKLVFIDVYVDRNEHVYPMQIAGQAMRDMWLTKGERT
ncbi:acetolactate synthase 3 large subunit [Psychrobacter sp. Urea-trap-16]|nr:acetolactate synthase 3 large subunit [Psychrobacter sp. Urea-trap-18]MBA6286803.1 acetolactate synthase 3 large subunit [Psychrobacter sp. Urea-trap-16]MBA6317482.1 acetolactate synthase 3 large subunit [Psychrobacter sp. Urea-trap-20]MBA6333337.1 acetolactate synthase 3 large subunit [Psychrobacter sp. Urea-trap-19]|tara:strand:+ start:3181 stop:5013 length:1833 start_codon:yes stop_codon:yes gene_type:complete